MDDTKTLLEGSRDRIEPSPLDLEAIYRRRDTRHSRRRAGAAALALVITVGGAAMFARAIGGAGATDPGTTGSQTGTAAPPAMVDIDIPGFPASAYMEAVAATDGTFVIVGDTSRADGINPVWVSSDGLTWARVTGPDAPDTSTLWDVIAGGPGFVAVDRKSVV